MRKKKKMDKSEWYNLMKGWVIGSDDNPIDKPIQRICYIALKIIDDCERISLKLANEDLDDLQILSPDLIELDDKLINVINIAEGVFIKSYKPTEKDLETEQTIQFPSESAEKKEIDEKDESGSKILDVLSELKPEDIEVKKVAEKIIKEKKNVFDEIKKTLIILKDRTDVQHIFKSQEIVHTQILQYLHEVLSAIGNIKSTLIFARKYYNNELGIRFATLFFMAITPERVHKPKSKGEKVNV